MTMQVIPGSSCAKRFHGHCVGNKRFHRHCIGDRQYSTGTIGGPPLFLHRFSACFGEEIIVPTHPPEGYAGGLRGHTSRLAFIFLYSRRGVYIF